MRQIKQIALLPLVQNQVENYHQIAKTNILKCINQRVSQLHRKSVHLKHF